MFSSDASDDVTGQTTNTKPSRHRRYANDSNVVVVARTRRARRCTRHCAVSSRTSPPNDANPAAGGPSKQATPSEDVSNPDDEERWREKFDHSASGAWFKELGERAPTRASSEHRKSRASHDADEDPQRFTGASPQKRLVDESSQKNDAIRADRRQTEPASTASKVKHGFKDDELDGLDVLVVEDNHFQLRIVKARSSTASRWTWRCTTPRLWRTCTEGGRGPEGFSRPDTDGLHDAGDGWGDGDAGDSRDGERVPVVKDGRRAQRRRQRAAHDHRRALRRGRSGYEQESRDAGMDGTLGKPCRPETMRKTLKEVHSGEWKRGTFQSASKTSLHF